MSTDQAQTTLTLNQADLPEPYRSVQLLPFDSHGWHKVDNAENLEKLIRDHKIQTIIEVGSWLGASTRHMASLLPAGGKIYAVDHWLGSSEHQPGERGWHKALAYLYEQFLSNVIHAGLTDKIVPIRMSSLEAAQQFSKFSKPLRPGLIYIDAGHETEAVYADLKVWYPFVQNHGILCGDDWGWESVQAGVVMFANEKGLKIESSRSFWRLVEPC